MLELSISDSKNPKHAVYFSDHYFKLGNNLLIQGLMMKTSLKVREESKEIIGLILKKNKDLTPQVMKFLIDSIPKVLMQEGNLNE